MATAAQALLGAVQGLGYVADTPGALLRGALAGRPGSRASGRELLQSLGLVGRNQAGLDVGDALGFATEMVADPLNLLGGARILKTALTGRKIAKANKASRALRAAGYMPEEIAALTKIREGGKPMRLLHGTASTPFRQFAEDPGSGNWMGKGVYFTREPDAADIYAEIDKSPLSARTGEFLQDWQSLIAQLPADKQAEAQGAISAAMTNAGQSIGGFTRNATSQLSQLLERHRHILNPVPGDAAYSGWMSQAKQLASSQRKGNQRVMMRYVDSRRPFRLEAPATKKDVEALLTGLQPDQKSAAMGMLSQLKAQQLPITKGRAWAIAASAMGDRYGRDRLTNALGQAGYDAMTHGSGASQDVVQTLRNAIPEFNREVILDSHSEVVPFAASQVYLPYIAPAIRPVPSAKGQAASLALFNLLRQGRPGQQPQGT